MSRTAREMFEATMSKCTLTRSGEGYLDPCVNQNWKIWQLAWTAAHCEPCRPKGAPLSKCELSQEEIEFIKKIVM